MLNRIRLWANSITRGSQLINKKLLEKEKSSGIKLIENDSQGPFGFWWLKDDFMDDKEDDERSNAHIMRFKYPSCVDKWTVYDDVKLGGKSISKFRFNKEGGIDKKGSVIFEGELNHAEAGSTPFLVKNAFSMLNLKDPFSPSLNISNYGIIEIKYKGDNRTYLLNATDDSILGGNNFQQVILPPTNGEWTSIEIKPYDFHSLRSSSQSRAIQVGLNYSCITMFSFGILDIIPGKFSLEIDSFKAVKENSREWEHEELQDHQWGSYFVENDKVFADEQNDIKKQDKNKIEDDRNKIEIKEEELDLRKFA